MIVSRLGVCQSSLNFTLTSTICVFFVKFDPKEITTIREQNFSLYSPHMAHISVLSPFMMLHTTYLSFNTRVKLIKYQEKKFASLYQDVCQLPTMSQFVTWSQDILPARSIILCVCFLEVYPKEITTIGEQMISLYSSSLSHFCSFTFWCYRPLTFPFNTRVNWSSIKKRNSPLCAKMSASYPQCISSSHDHKTFYLGVNHSWHLSIIHILRLSVSAGFHIAHHRGLSHETPSKRQPFCVLIVCFPFV